MQDAEANFTFDEEPVSAVRRLALPFGTVALGMFLVYSSCYVVSEQCVGVVLRFDRHVRTARPGISLKLPWPIERVRIENVTEVRTALLGANQPLSILSADGHPLNCSARVRYKVVPAEIHQYLFTTKSVETVVSDLAISAIRTASAGHNADDLFGQMAALRTRAELHLKQHVAQYSMGVQIVGFDIEKLSFPPEVVAAIDSVAHAGKDAFQAVALAENYRRQKAEDSARLADEIVRRQKSDSQNHIQEAKAEVERFDRLLDEYRAQPDNVKRSLYLDTLKKMLPHVQKVLLEDAPEPKESGR